MVWLDTWPSQTGNWRVRHAGNVQHRWYRWQPGRWSTPFKVADQSAGSPLAEAVHLFTDSAMMASCEGRMDFPEEDNKMPPQW